MTYPNTYQRPCRHCGRPILNAARNQRQHVACGKTAKARARKLRRECRRAALGMFPGDRVPLERIKLPRRTPATPETQRAYYGWHTCRTPGCREQFYAGRNAKYCQACRARSIRARNARQHQRRKLRGRRPPRSRVA